VTDIEILKAPSHFVGRGLGEMWGGF